VFKARLCRFTVSESKVQATGISMEDHSRFGGPFARTSDRR
jgi:hypothetical protein